MLTSRGGEGTHFACIAATTVAKIYSTYPYQETSLPKFYPWSGLVGKECKRGMSFLSLFLFILRNA